MRCFPGQNDPMDLPVMPPVAPMLAKSVKDVPDGPGFLYEPKWDGFRCIVFRDGDEVELGSRNERPMTRYFPEVVAAVKEQLPERCVVDAEIVIAAGDKLDFEALLQRIHPAKSRVDLLATPVAKASPPAGKQWVDVVAKTPEGGFRQGNPDAPIKLVEYGSRTCPTCGRFAAEGVEPLRAQFISTGQVSYEFRDFPLHGAPDFALALLNQCVGADAFFPMLDRMFANQSNFLDKQQKLPEATSAFRGS